MKILVLGGCGAMGSETTRDLSKTGKEFDGITVADIDLGRAEAFAKSLEDPRVGAVKVDLTDEAALTKLMSAHDLVANCTPYAFA